MENAPAGPQKGLVVCLALAATVFGTPILFDFIGPWVEELSIRHYGEDLGTLMYGCTYLLLGAIIYYASQLTLLAALASVSAFGALRFAGAL